MLYAYGAVRAGQVPPGVSGIDGSPVCVLEAAGLGVAVSELPRKVEPTRVRLVQHHRVTMALLRGGGVAPFRFGNVFPGEAELRRGLEPRASELGQRLEALAGCVEMGLRLPLGANEPAAGRGQRQGTAYLLRKRRQITAADELHARLKDVLKDWQQEPSAEGVLAAACLVEQRRVDELRARLAEVAPEAEVSGPWPPSSFV
jgi:hypothetical protein